MRTFQATTAPSRTWRDLGSFLLIVTLACLGDAARAQDAVATVTHIAGLSTARRDDGSTRLLAARSVIHEGETLVTEPDTWLEVQFVDDAVLVVGPASRVQVTRYSWNPEHPAADRVVLELLGGSLRSETGRLGKRNHDAILVKVPGGEIAVHGTTFVAQSMPAGVPGTSGAPAPPTSGGLAPGLYVQVIDGAISLSNKGGSTNFAAGQFGYTASIQQPPVVVPKNPGIQFTPPPVFNQSTGPSASQSPSKSNVVDCEVR